jgi:hypothetical protein
MKKKQLIELNRLAHSNRAEAHWKRMSKRELRYALTCRILYMAAIEAEAIRAWAKEREAMMAIRIEDHNARLNMETAFVPPIALACAEEWEARDELAAANRETISGYGGHATAIRRKSGPPSWNGKL